jgi:hypothetical protein
MLALMTFLFTFCFLHVAYNEKVNKACEQRVENFIKKTKQH